MDYNIIFIVLACVIGLWMTWGIGANDLANIVSPAMGSHAITLKQAILIAVIFEIAGAFVGGTQVTETIRGGIIDMDALRGDPKLLIYTMLSVLLAGACWMNIASYLGMPVSITNAVVGALVGVGAIALGIHAIYWQTVGYIAISWISSPAIAGVLSYLLFISIRRSILGDEHPVDAAKYYLPLYLFLVSIILSLMMMLKALDHFKYDVGVFFKSILVLLTASAIWVTGYYSMRHIHVQASLNRHKQFLYIEALFSVLTLFTACAMVFAHGSNDVAIAVGPVAAVVSLAKTGSPSAGLYNSIMLFGCIGVVLGLLMYGRKVIATVGIAITTLTPSRAFAAMLAAASTVVASTSTGIPVSATQTLVGAVFGVGLARGIDALNLNVIRNIFLSWIVTIPVTAALATGFFYLLRILFGY